ncbi:MAG: VanZ family protein [Candidatus Hydrogenedentes bacterium]|nr:VanZ family protein [Candidatus Hydrogenedentota bacterium]
MRPRYLLLIFLYCGFIFWLSSQSRIPDPILYFPGKDKVAHLALYTGLGFLISWGRLRSRPDAGWATLYLVPVLFVGLYGLSDEIHQRYVSNRNFDLFDLAADVVGGLLAQVILYMTVIRRARNSGREETVCEIRG